MLRAWGGLLNVRAITDNMRTHRTGRVALVAKRHKPFVTSAYGTTLHRVGAVRVDFRTADRASLLALFHCGGSASRPVFYDSAEGHPYRLCRACFKHAATSTEGL